MSVLLLSFAALAANAAAAFCAGLETGFLSVSRGRILHMARLGGAHAKVVQAALTDLPRTTTALLVGNNLASVTYASSTSALAAAVFAGAPAAQAAASAAAAFAMLCLGEFLPKLVFAMRPLGRTLAAAPLWRIASKVLVPAGGVVQTVIGPFLPKREAPARMTPEAVLKILEDRRDGVKLSDFESALIGRLMVLRANGQQVSPESLLSVLDHDLEDEP